ncbi:MAG TPA: VOC family protein [Thermoplasmata archaeon]|nr:VOC family protein [Thermoplasmata archaeon]
MTDKPGAIVHVEFHSNDPDRTKAFYSRVFGWRFEDIPQMNYATFKAPTGPGGGLQKPGEGGPMILNYLLTDEINETAKAIEANGGAVLVPKSEIPGFGWWSLFKDPTGLTMALYQAMRPPRPPAPKKKSAKKSAKAGKKARGRTRGR